MTTALEQSFADICEKHNLSSFAVKIVRSRRFVATAHWEGFTRSGNACATEFGDSIAEAITNTLAAATADRASDVIVLADERLPEEAAAAEVRRRAFDEQCFAEAAE
jgi:hypothetical protein